jgi:putative two-component system response regulator
MRAYLAAPPGIYRNRSKIEGLALQDELRKEARILVVDDEPQNVRYITDVLNWAGYEHVEGVTDPLEAVPRYQEVDPDLVILDLLMPELDGFGVMETIQGMLSDDAYLPILVLTSDISSEARRRALGGGAKDFLNKPMSPTELRLRVDNLLETRFLYLKCASQALELGTLARDGGERALDAEFELLECWAATLERASPGEAGHAKRVSWLSGRLAEVLEVPSQEVELIRRAALLHGLASTRPAGRPLEGAEAGRGNVQEVGSGLRVLEGSSLPVLERAREMLSGLAESWDGSGAPSGLRGPVIPLVARIVAVAAHFDSLTHGSASASGQDDPLAEMERLAGRRFDPAIVEALLQTESARTV